MTSTVRDFKDFTKFPGDIIKGAYVFPTLYSRDKMNRIRFWKLQIIMVDKVSLLDDYAHDWDPKREQIEVILSSYLNSKTKVPDEFVAMIYNEQGLTQMLDGTSGKCARHPPTIIVEGSPGLKGKANARNTITQSLILARSQWQKKIDDGYSIDVLATKTKADRYYAMAAHKFDDNLKYVIYPCYSQPKLDGVRCIMKLEDGEVIKYSRDQNIWMGYDEFDSILKPAFDKYPNLHIDGELYKHGKKLQEITGVARKRTSSSKKFELNYHMFDCFIGTAEGLKQSTDERAEILDDVMRIINTNKSSVAKRLVEVPTSVATHRVQLDKLYQEYISEGYEGQMVRSIMGTYDASKDREIRSRSILKRKKRFDSEFPLTDVLEGTKGRAKGAFIGVFQNKQGKTFKASPKDMTMLEMKELFKCVIADLPSYIGREATIEYEDLSKDNVPLRPKFVMFRDVK